MNPTVLPSRPGVPVKDTPVWRIDHVNVFTGARRALQALFEGVMGLQPGHRPPFPFPGQWLYAGEQAVVHAVDDGDLSAATGELRFGHIAFRGEQPAAQLIARLQDSTLPFRIARVPGDNTVQIFVQLPGNFVVELDVPDEGGAPSDHHYTATRSAPGSSDF